MKTFKRNEIPTPLSKTMEMELSTEPQWASELKRTPTVPGRCCQGYLEYLREGGEVPRMPKLVRHGKHLLFLRRYGRFTPSFDTMLLLLATRRRNGDKSFAPAYKPVSIKVCTFDMESPQYIDSVIARKEEYGGVSQSEIKTLTGLRAATELCRGKQDGPARAIFTYYLLSGACQYCDALVQPNLLIDNGFEKEARIADEYRETNLAFLRAKHPGLWQKMTAGI